MGPTVVQGCPEGRWLTSARRALLSPCLWPPRWDLLPPGSRGLVLGAEVSRPVANTQGASERTRYWGPRDSAQPKAREPGEGHSPWRPPLGEPRQLQVAGGGGGLAPGSSSPSAPPARPWGRTWPGSGHPRFSAFYPAVPALLASTAVPAPHYKWRKPQPPSPSVPMSIPFAFLSED